MTAENHEHALRGGRAKGSPSDLGARRSAGPLPGGTGSSPGWREERYLLESGLGFRLGRVTRTLRRGWAEELAGLGLTPPQAAVLRAVAGQPGCSLRALARTLGAEPMTAKRCVDDLEGRCLLESAHRGDDRRPRAFTLTPGGRDLAERVELLARLQERRLDQLLGADRRAHLEEALGVLEADLGLPSISNRRGAAGPHEKEPARSPAEPGRTRQSSSSPKEQR